MAKKAASVQTGEPVRFSKAKILTLQRYADRRDLLGAILDENRAYSIYEIDEAIDKFLKGKVM